MIEIIIIIIKIDYDMLGFEHKRYVPLALTPTNGTKASFHQTSHSRHKSIVSVSRFERRVSTVFRSIRSLHGNQTRSDSSYPIEKCCFNSAVFARREIEKRRRERERERGRSTNEEK